MEEAHPTLLIVEDDLDIAEMLSAYFSVQGYQVATVNWGEDGVRACLSHTPDLVILDIRLPDIDGFEVARRLRANRRTKDIPIVFLTEKRERSDRLRGLELQADDYITKPFDIQELRLRVRNALRRVQRATLTHPITGLPQGGLVDEALVESLERDDAALLVISLQNLNRFREVYGFVASDDLLRAVAMMMRELTSDLGASEDFLGQLAPGNFLVITGMAQVPAARERIRRRLEQSFGYFYSEQDRAQGTFRDHPLSVLFDDFAIASLPQRDLVNLKAELSQYCR